MGPKRIVDVVVLVFAVLLTLTNLVSRLPPLPEPYDAVAFGLQLAGVAALWFRRRAPVEVAWFLAAVTVVLGMSGWIWPGSETTLTASAAPFAAYSVARYGRGRRLAWLPLVVMAVVASVASSGGLAAVGSIVTLVGGSAVLGLYIGARCETVVRKHEQARADERLRLAAEIHDVVSHRVTAMVLQAGALQLTAESDATRRAAGDLRSTGCEALNELRDLVGLLNEPGPQPSSALADLSQLVSASESVGIAVDLRESGEARPLPSAVGRTAYRVVQEALTNVRKHAPGSRAEVEVRYLPSTLTISVRNTAPAAVCDAGLAGSGLGLLGLRRRIELLDGTLSAGPSPDGGFRVEASLAT